MESSEISEQNAVSATATKTCDGPQGELQPSQNNRIPSVSWASKAKEVASITALTAERAAIVTVSMPAAYEKLGRQYHAANYPAETYVDLIQQINVLQQSLQDSRTHSRQSPPPQTLAARAKDLASQGARVAVEQKAKLKISSLLRDLGKRVYEQGSANPGGLEQCDAIDVIRRHLTRLGDIDKELAKLKQRLHLPRNTLSSRWKRYAVVMSSLSFMVFFGWFMLRWPDSSRKAPANGDADGPRQPVAVTANDMGQVVNGLKDGTRGLATLSRDISASASRSSAAFRKDLERSQQEQLQQLKQRETSSPSSPSPDAMRVAEDLVKRLDWEQSLQPVDSGGRILLLPAAPRMGTAHPLYTQPVRVIDTATDNVSQLAVFEADGLAQIGEAAYQWPSLSPFNAETGVGDFEALPFFKTVAEWAGTYNSYETPQRVGQTKKRFDQKATRCLVLGSIAIPLGGGSLAVLGSDILAAGPRTDGPAVLFWQREQDVLRFVNAFALNSNQGSAENVVIASKPWDNKFAVLKEDINSNATLLEIWGKAGRVGSLMVTRAVTNSTKEYPLALSVNSSGIAALLYKSSIRFVDLKVVTGLDIELSAVEKSAFSFPNPSADIGDNSIARWSQDGKRCFVERVRGGTEGGVVEVYDVGGRIVGSLEQGRAGALCDISQDGRRMIIRRPYCPKEGATAAASEVYELEIFSVPDLTAVGKVVTCFARHARLLANGDLIAGGTVGENERRLVAGGWEQQTINSLVGGNYITRWNVASGTPVWRIKDVDVDALRVCEDGQVVLTTRRAKGDVGAAVCVWDTKRRADESAFVDEFVMLRERALQEESKHRNRITLPASPVDGKKVAELKKGQTYAQVKDLLRGAGELEAEVIVKDAQPVIRAQVDYACSGSRDEVYRLVFESDTRQRGQYFGDGLVLVSWDKIRP